MPVRVRVSPSAPFQNRSEIALQGGRRVPIIRVPIDAGWSSLVARRAHNPKVVGSNPAPATTTIGLHWSLNASITHRVPTRDGLG